MWQNFKSLFTSPVIAFKTVERDGHPHYEMTISSLVCFNLLSLDKTLAHLPDDVGVTLRINESGRIIDHTAMEYLHQFQEECVRDKRTFEIFGLENFVKFTNHSLAARMQDTLLIKEQNIKTDRERFMEEVARNNQLSFETNPVSTINKEGFVYLRRGADKEECHIMAGDHHGCDIRLFDYSHTSAPDYYSKHWHTLITFPWPKAEGENVPDFVITPGHYLERYLVDFSEVEFSDKEGFSDAYRLYGMEGQDPRSHLSTELLDFILEHKGFYVEVHNGVLLAFKPNKQLVNDAGIAELLELAEVTTGAKKA